MNERMIELANKANEDIGYTFKLEDAKQIHELMEKFAELIVRECCQFEKTYGGDAGLVARSFSRKIREHFGVEE